jgi:glycosyltransferase involved in cell wall biosynthesis
VLISIIITVKNEARNIRDLLDSLVVQEGPLEILVVDADSRDGTQEIVQDYAERYDFIRLLRAGGTRGAARNYGVAQAKGEVVAFIDGDCIANPFWIHHIREGFSYGDIVAGKTIQLGYKAWEDLERVELIFQGYDITYPSCNLAYRREAFEDVGGFDEWFVTAEDIDLNLRAVRSGYTMHVEDEAIVYHRTRASVYDFLKQAFWNGAGRKQLTLKHGSLWGHYRPLEMVRRKMTIWSAARLVLALLGYVGHKLFGTSQRPVVEKPAPAPWASKPL